MHALTVFFFRCCCLESKFSHSGSSPTRPTHHVPAHPASTHPASTQPASTTHSTSVIVRDPVIDTGMCAHTQLTPAHVHTCIYIQLMEVTLRLSNNHLVLHVIMTSPSHWSAKLGVDREGPSIISGSRPNLVCLSVCLSLCLSVCFSSCVTQIYSISSCLFFSFILITVT